MLRDNENYIIFYCCYILYTNMFCESFYLKVAISNHTDKQRDDVAHRSCRSGSYLYFIDTSIYKIHSNKLIS